MPGTSVGTSEKAAQESRDKDSLGSAPAETCPNSKEKKFEWSSAVCLGAGWGCQHFLDTVPAGISLLVL